MCSPSTSALTFDLNIFFSSLGFSKRRHMMSQGQRKEEKSNFSKINKNVENNCDGSQEQQLARGGCRGRCEGDGKAGQAQKLKKKCKNNRQ